MVATPDIRLITTTGSKLIINNRGKQLGRRGLIVSGPSGPASPPRSPSSARKHHIGTDGGPGPDRADPGGLHHRPARRHPPDAGHRVRRVPRPAGQRPRQTRPTSPRPSPGCCARRLHPGLVDEVHRLNLRTRSGAEASDQLKYFADPSAPPLSTPGSTWRTTACSPASAAGRSPGGSSACSPAAFGLRHRRPAQHWARADRDHGADAAAAPPQARHPVEMAPYLHQRTGGMIGSLDQLVHEAANDAIRTAPRRSPGTPWTASAWTTPPEPPAPAARPPPGGHHDSAI